MISRSELVCFGFGRIDFEARRPTVARCVDLADTIGIPVDGLVSLTLVQAGTDTWFVLAAGGDVDSVSVTGAGGVPVDDGRIHVDGEVIALRLSNTAPPAELSWIVGRTRYTCTPARDVAQTGTFCSSA